ncbi:MAG: putative amidohydrolase [Haloarculaceae archaeon]|jgi:predicted amidohydrolase
MTQVSVDETIVSETITHNQTVDVPSGSVYLVYVNSGFYGGNSGRDVFLEVNGNTVFEYRGSTLERPMGRIILAGGDSLGVRVGDGSTDVYALVSGYDVSSQVENGVVSSVLGHNETVDVPTGETWKVNIHTTYFAGNSGENSVFKVNGNAIGTHTSSDQHTFGNSLFFNEGDTLSFVVDAGATDVHAHVGGFVL